MRLDLCDSITVAKLMVTSGYLETGWPFPAKRGGHFARGETREIRTQLNALALSVFLSLNLGMPDPPLDSVLLDDPLQSLDEVNLLGVVDLLRRRYKAKRQLVISTHDRRFAGLLQRKLRATEPDEPIAIVSLSDWGRGGPRVQEVVSGVEGNPWKIAAIG